MAIVLGIGLGVVSLIIMCLLCVCFLFQDCFHPRFVDASNPCRLTIFVNRRERRPSKSKSNSNDKLRKLDTVSPTRTLEEWWSKAKGPLLPSDCVDGQFIW